MADKKNQHFVPRFYLKHFSLEYNGKFLGLYNIPNEKFIEKAALNGQASKNYFYGKDLSVENALGQIEQDTSNVFNTMSSTGLLPPNDSLAHHILLTFITTLSARTEYAGSQLNESVDKITKQIIKYDSRFKELGINPSSFTIGYEKPSVMALQVAVECLPLLLDLEFKFLVNETNEPFITSDNPVIKYNQFYERLKKVGGHTGYASKGLQLFFPIFPDLYVLFYDRDVYRVGNKRDKTIKISDQRDVQKLNLLQYVNAFENIYFNSDFSIDNADNLKTLGFNFRKASLSNVNEYFGQGGSLLHMYSNDTKIGLKLSFISEVKKARKYDLGNKVVHYRNEKLVQEFEERRKNG